MNIRKLIYITLSISSLAGDSAGGSTSSFLIHFDDLSFDLGDVAALELVALVLLLQQLQVPLDLLPPLSLELPLKPRHGLLLRLLSHPPLCPLTLDPLTEQLDLVPVVTLDRVHHQTVLLTLPLLRLLVLALFL